MKSEINNVDLRTPYCAMLFKRSPEEQVSIRQAIVRYAQQKGNKPTARHYGCDVRTVREWRKRFERQGTGALKNSSRAPHRCSHKTLIVTHKGRDKDIVREFQCFTSGIQEMIRWLQKCSVKTIVMESTGSYWIPVFEMLDQSGFEVKLVDAHHIKNVRGRKSDVIDCQWLQQLHMHGLLSGAFRPENDIIELRSYLKQRSMLIETVARHTQHMQKAMIQMNLHLHNVISDITGVTGMAIIRAILKGETNPDTLAKMRNPCCKNPIEIIKKSLEGNYRDEHLFALSQAVDAFDFFQTKIRECDEQIKKNFKSDVPSLL